MRASSADFAALSASTWERISARDLSRSWEVAGAAACTVAGIGASETVEIDRRRAATRGGMEAERTGPRDPRPELIETDSQLDRHLPGRNLGLASPSSSRSRAATAFSDAASG